MVTVTISFVVAALLVGWGLKARRLKGGSVLAGLLLGLVLTGTPAGPPLAHAVQNAAVSIGHGVVTAFHTVVGR